MKNVWVISRREFRTYLTSPMSYVVTATFLALSGTFFSTYLAVTEYADASIRGFLNASQILILLFAAVLTMRSIAEEKKLGTWELLLTFPLTNAEIVFGKYLGSFAVFVGMLGLTLYYPILLFVFGDPDLGPIFTSYLWLVMLGAASLSVGVFASSVSSNQIVSVVISGGILFALAFLGLMAEFVPGGGGDLLAYLSLTGYFREFVVGIVDTRAVVYYLSLTAVFLFLSVRSVEADRWR